MLCYQKRQFIRLFSNVLRLRWFLKFSTWCFSIIKCLRPNLFEKLKSFIFLDSNVCRYFFFKAFTRSLVFQEFIFKKQILCFSKQQYIHKQNQNATKNSCISLDRFLLASSTYPKIRTVTMCSLLCIWPNLWVYSGTSFKFSVNRLFALVRYL